MQEQNINPKKPKIWYYLLISILCGFLIYLFTIISSIAYFGFFDEKFIKIQLIIFIIGFVSILVVLILVLKFYYKIKLFNKDRLKEDESGNLYVEKYDSEKEKKLKASIKQIDDLINDDQ